MVKRKATRKKARAAPRRKAAPKRRKKYSSGTSVKLMDDVLLPAGYGAVREMASDKLVPLAAKVPLVGQGLAKVAMYADEVVMGTAAYILTTGRLPLMKKKLFTPNKLVKRFAHRALIVEASRMGETVSNQFQNRQTAKVSAPSGQLF